MLDLNARLEALPSDAARESMLAVSRNRSRRPARLMQVKAVTPARSQSDA
jgi:hypothetical protein